MINTHKGCNLVEKISNVAKKLPHRDSSTLINNVFDNKTHILKIQNLHFKY